MFGDVKVKVAHFSFFLGFVGWVGEGDWVVFSVLWCWHNHNLELCPTPEQNNTVSFLDLAII